MNDAFLAIPDLKGVIVGGPGHTKEEFVEGDYLHHEIKQKSSPPWTHPIPVNSALGKLWTNPWMY